MNHEMALNVRGESVPPWLFYSFLSRTYAYPDSNLIDLLFVKETWEQLSDAEAALELGADSTIRELRAWVEQHAGATEELLADLEVEHTYLFINAVPHVPASPYESAYAGRGLLMGEPVSKVLQAYRDAGLAISEDYDGLPDHITAELEFMAYLIQQQAQAEQEDSNKAATWKERQDRFLDEHLLRWGPVFLDKVASSARNDFYRHLAGLLEALLQAEEQRMTALTPHRNR
jgi:DMSO reductase family type II enzyme chaperone